MTKNILVTGGAGYIGAQTCKALSASGFTPVVYDNLSTGNIWSVQWGPFEHGDICDGARLRAVMDKVQPVGIIHFAALALVGESMTDPAIYYRTNVGGLVEVLDACRGAGVENVVFSSSCAVYGAPERMPIDEATPQNPINPYGASKAVGERVLADYSAAFGIRYAALRYFNAAGADPEAGLGEARAIETHLVPLAVDALLGRRPALKRMGDDFPTRDGTAVRDYVHVIDLAEAHVKALRSLLAGGASRVMNLGTGHGASVSEVIEAVSRIGGKPMPVEQAPRRPGDPPELVADPKAAREFLGPDALERSKLDAIVESTIRWRTSPVYDRWLASQGTGS
ncbi:MAG: UDP-glucose 4-epimerase GalE [Pseudomonadota bacterium]